MMRALRFAAVYGFAIEAETTRAIHALSLIHIWMRSISAFPLRI